MKIFATFMLSAFFSLSLFANETSINDLDINGDDIPDTVTIEPGQGNSLVVKAYTEKTETVRTGKIIMGDPELKIERTITNRFFENTIRSAKTNEDTYSVQLDDVNDDGDLDIIVEYVPTILSEPIQRCFFNKDGKATFTTVLDLCRKSKAEF
jgi:type 1 fimbria pilin